MHTCQVAFVNCGSGQEDLVAEAADPYEYSEWDLVLNLSDHRVVVVAMLKTFLKYETLYLKFFKA